MEDYGKFTEFYKRMQRYPSVLIPSGTDIEKSSVGDTLVKWDSTMELSVLYTLAATLG